MVKRLRRRFVLINTAILTLVMCAVFSGIYLMMYRSEQKESQTAVHQALSASWSEGRPAVEQYSGRNLIYLTLYNETNEAELAYSINGGREEALVLAAAWELLGNPQYSGETEIGTGTYYYEYKRQGDAYRMVLADQTAEKDTMRRLLRNFFVIGGVGLIGILVISILLARWEMKPIVAAWETQKNFVSDASHELKTPLAVIATNTDLVLANPDSTISEQHKWLDYMKDETARMSKLVANLLFIAKVDAHEIRAVRTELDFSAFLEEACMEYETAVFEAGRMLDYQIESGITMSVDQDKIRRVLDILMDNAQKYSNPQSEIRVRLFRDKLGRVCLLVGSEGEVISKECQARLFDRFYRLDSSRARDTGGYGLGLNIAKCIVELHEGTITASCDEKGKTVVSIVF